MRTAGGRHSTRPGSPAEWRDVTSLFDEAAKAMSVGQLVHVASFDLFRTMSALDVGDPQTDSGCACHLENTKTLRRRLVDGDVEMRSCSGLLRGGSGGSGASSGAAGDDGDGAADVTLPPLTPSTSLGTLGVVAIVDALLAYEVEYLSGQQDVQTTLTCFYAHGPVLARMRKELFETCRADADAGRGVPATAFFEAARKIPLVGRSAEKGNSDPHGALSPEEVAELSAPPFQAVESAESEEEEALPALTATPESAPMLAWVSPSLSLSLSLCLRFLLVPSVAGKSEAYSQLT